MENKSIGEKNKFLIALGIGYVSMFLAGYVFAVRNEYLAKVFSQRTYQEEQYLHVDFAQKGYRFCNIITGNLGYFEEDIVRNDFYNLFNMEGFDYRKKNVDMYVERGKVTVGSVNQYDMANVNTGNVYRTFLNYYIYFKTYTQKESSSEIFKKVADIVEYHKKLTDCLIKQHNNIIPILCEEAYIAINKKEDTDITLSLDVLSSFMKNIEYTSKYIDPGVIEKNISRLEVIKGNIVSDNKKNEHDYMNNAKKLNQICNSLKNIIKKKYTGSICRYRENNKYKENYREKILGIVSKIEINSEK